MTGRPGSGDGVVSDPTDLAEWRLHCYCPTARQTPQSLVREGSNGRLLYEARAGTTRSRLRTEGVPVTEDQLARLVAFGLLTVDGERLHTRFPVLGGAITTGLRQQLHLVGGSLAGRIAPGVTQLRRELADRGLGNSEYAVVFGHALDGLLWGRLRADGAVPDPALSAEQPWWNGAFWAVYPGRVGSAGTNFVDCGDATLVLVWTDSTVADLNALATAEHLRQVVAGLLADQPSDPGVVTDREHRRWQLRRPDGRPAMPVLGTGGRLDVVSGQLAEIVAESLNGDEVAVARDLVPTDDRAVATVVVAHELIWDVTEALIQSGTLRPPSALAPGRAAPETLVDLLYLNLGEV